MVNIIEPHLRKLLYMPKSILQEIRDPGKS